MVVSIDEEGAFSCCASRRFAQRLAHASPFQDEAALITEARRVWWHECGVVEWLAALSAHPKIGSSKPQSDAGQAFASFSHSEQSTAAQTSTEAISEELVRWNQAYLDKFGFIFIIFANGRTSAEILAALKERFHRLPHQELEAAAQEQMKITEMRLGKLVASLNPGLPGEEAPLARMHRRANQQVLAQVVPAPAGGPLVSPITTHVLDTALGCPAEGLALKLLKLDSTSNCWATVSEGVTNQDGRVPALLPPSNYLAPGRYRMYFATSPYLLKCRQQHGNTFPAIPFYPEVTIDFEISPDKASEHYHIPLLLSPYGYSTYRGS